VREVHPARVSSLPPASATVRRELRHQYGPRSEKLDLDQLHLGLEDEEQGAAEREVRKTRQRDRRDGGAYSRPTAIVGRCRHSCNAMKSWWILSAKTVPAAVALYVIREDRTEQLDIVPSQLRVKVICRPRYACRTCEGAVVQAPVPERPIDGGIATEALVAHVVVSKFCDSLPLYRQAQTLKRQGITLDRSTVSTWVGRACWWLTRSMSW
jgi:transposase